MISALFLAAEGLAQLGCGIGAGIATIGAGLGILLPVSPRLLVRFRQT